MMNAAADDVGDDIIVSVVGDDDVGDGDDDVEENEEVLCKGKLFTRLFHLDSRSY